MKLRIRGDSLRLRLDRREIDQLVTEGSTEDAIHFGLGQRLCYTVCARDQDALLTATFDGERVQIGIQAAEALRLAQTDLVSVEAIQQIDSERTLRLLLEKDFVCLQPRSGEDDAHAYANPRETHPCST